MTFGLYEKPKPNASGRGGALLRPAGYGGFMELYGELVCTCLLNCRGDVGVDPDNQPCGHLRIRRRFLKKALHPAGGQSRPPLRTDLLQNRSFNETTADPGVNRERLVLCLYRSVTLRSFLSFSRTAFVTPVVSSSVSVRSSARSSRLNATLFLPGAMPGPR